VRPTEVKNVNVDFEDFKEIFYFGLRYERSFSKLEAKDINNSSATILSNLNESLNLNFSQTLAKNIRLKQEIGIKKETYPSVSSVSSNRILNNQISVNNFGFGADYLLSKNIDIGLLLSQTELLFYKGYLADSSGIELFLVPLLNLKTNLDYRLLETQKASLNLGLELAYFFGTETNYGIKIDNSWESSLSLFYKRQLQYFLFEPRFYFKTNNQRSSVIKINRTDVGLSLGIGFNF
jgi:hypothetical protein